MLHNSENINEIKKRIIEGDNSAFDQLYRMYFGRLKYYGLQFAPKLLSYSIDDTIQELFIWIVKNRQKLVEVENLEVYLFSALKRNVYQEIYKKTNQQKVKNKFLASTNNDDIEDSVENKFINLEQNARLSNNVNILLEQLPPKQKEVLYLRNYVNMSYSEIAQVMNLSEQVVRNYSYRAMQKLRIKLVPANHWLVK